MPQNRPDDDIGPVQAHFRRLAPVEGYVVGPYGGASPHLRDLMVRIAKKGADTKYRDIGCSSPKEAFPTIYTRCLRVLGITHQVAIAKMLRDMTALARQPLAARLEKRRRRRASQTAYQRATIDTAARAGWSRAPPYGMAHTWRRRNARIARRDDQWEYIPPGN